jgi:alkylation response protein AidB-like acyl-CoA dehydrogenase
MSTRVSTVDGDRQLLNGEKYYSTGSIFADWISVYAKRAKPAAEDGEPEDDDLIVLVAADAPGVETVDDWTGFGQRNTGSGTTRLKDVETSPLGTYLFTQRAPYQEAIYQLVHVATLAGIARAASREAVDALRQRTRAYPHGLDDVPAKDAQLQAIVGRVAALSGAAEASVQRAAARLDISADTSHSPAASEEQIEVAVHAAAIAVYEAQLTVSDDVLTATTLLFDALGSSAVDESRRLDRHWRNARTVASHNPRVYKERIVGDWYLNGTPPRVFGGGDEAPAADSAAGEQSATRDADAGSGA